MRYCKYYSSISKAHAQVLQSLVVSWCSAWPLKSPQLWPNYVLREACRRLGVITILKLGRIFSSGGSLESQHQHQGIQSTSGLFPGSLSLITCQQRGHFPLFLQGSPQACLLGFPQTCPITLPLAKPLITWFMTRPGDRGLPDHQQCR